jgi:hypothetical protein
MCTSAGVSTLLATVGGTSKKVTVKGQYEDAQFQCYFHQTTRPRMTGSQGTASTADMHSALGQGYGLLYNMMVDSIIQGILFLRVRWTPYFGCLSDSEA